jgi:O-antigen/teichoic acid export membrane protein
MVSNLVSPILDRLDRFLLGAFAGVGSVGYYTAPQEIVQRLRVVPSALAQTLFPEFSALSTPGQADRGRVYYAMGIRFLALVLSPVTLVLALAGPDILRAWLGPDFARQSGTALQFLAAGIFANALASVPYSFLHGINRPDLPAKFHLLELPIFLGLAVVLMPRFGVAGAGAVWALRTGLDLLLLMRAAASHGAVSGPRPVRSGAVAWTLIYCAGVAVGFIPAFGRLPASARLGIAIIACVLIAVTGWFGLLPPEDRARVRRATASLATSVVR